MNQSTLEAALGRPLTPTEVTNLNLYLKIARQSLDELLCMTLCDKDDPKVYDAREGYSTVFVDIFTDVSEVKIDGTVIDPSKYSKRQWDRRNGGWYNSLVFETPFRSYDKEVEVSATWGFEQMPADLQFVLAGLFDLVTKKNKLDPSVQRKRVEDFDISFNVNVDLDSSFYTKYRTTIARYSICNIGNMQHGRTC